MNTDRISPEESWTMRVSNLGQHLLVCHGTDVELLHSVNLQGEPIHRSEKLCIFAVEQNFQKLRKALSPIPQFSIRRYLDKFYICTPKDNPKRRQEVLDSFFQLIASEYESLIDIERNTDNIRSLLAILSQLLNPIRGSLIVDYGCGTGLSIIPASAFDIRLVGVDRCPKMRQIAASKGMKVWGVGELARQSKDSIDGAFASYVFHLLPDTHGLRLLWARLRIGGVLVANFHKNQGLELVNMCVKELQGSAIQLASSLDVERHGTYAAYRKEK